MKLFCIILAALVISLGVIGCSTAPKILPNELPSIPVLPGTGAAIQAGQRALWPIYLASFVCILGGAAYGIFFKNWKLLAVGIGLALVPPVFLMFLQPVAPYVSWMVLAAGAGLLGLLGYRIYDYIRDEERKSAKPD